MTTNLFRTEVAARKTPRGQGGISLAQPLRWWAVTALASACAAIVAGLLVFGNYTRRSHVTGVLMPTAGLVTVMAQSDGIVEGLQVQEGDDVAQHAMLVAISSPKAVVTGEATSAVQDEIRDRIRIGETLRAAQLKQIDVQAGRLEGQIELSRMQLSQVREAIGTRSEQARLGRETLKRYESVSGKYVSEIQLAQQRQAVLEQLSARQVLERQETELLSTIAGLQQDLRQIPSQREAVLAVAAKDRSLLQRERISEELLSKYRIRSPVAGVVAARMVELGQAVRQGQPLLTLVPAGSSLEAQLMIPSSAVGFVREGDVVLLRYDAFPFQKFGHQRGRVTRISRSAFSQAAAKAGESGPSDGHYRILVRLEKQTISVYGKRELLRPGMTFKADVLGERRKLYEWVLEPLYSVGGSLAN